MYFDPNENYVILEYWLLNWAAVSGCLLLIVMFVSMSSLVAARGAGGIGIFFTEIGAMLSDIFSLSPRRVWALTRLSFMEAFRRKVLSVFVVFALLFMFAGWFMGSSKDITPDQVKVYVSFVLTSMAWLTLPVVLILACFGIPEDIRLRSSKFAYPRIQRIRGHRIGAEGNPLIYQILNYLQWVCKYT